MDMELLGFSSKPSNLRRIAVPGMVLVPVGESGATNVVAQDIEVVASNDEFFDDPGQLEREVADIRERGENRFHNMRNFVSLTPERVIKFQAPRTISLGGLGVMHTGGWRTLRTWPFDAPTDAAGPSVSR